jgi:hypothetical protein
LVFVQDESILFQDFVSRVEPKLTKDSNQFRREASDCTRHMLRPLSRVSQNSRYLHGIVPNETKVTRNQSVQQLRNNSFV